MGKEEYQEEIITLGTDYPRLATLRREALVRDDFTCYICGLRDPDTAIVIFNQRLFYDGKQTVDNLKTLCPSCRSARDHGRAWKRSEEIQQDSSGLNAAIVSFENIIAQPYFTFIEAEIMALNGE